MTWSEAFSTVETAARSCRQCGACAHRCEVLEDAGAGAGEALTVGALARAFCEEGVTPEKAAALAAARPELVRAVRRCCMDGFCTLSCPDGIEARAVFAALRELLALAQVTTADGFTMTQVDREWHIFSVYRAVYGIWYNDLPGLAEAAETGADTLFFPGCTLASYAPELTREVFAWLGAQGLRVVISDACCGSPLRSGGFADRANAHRRSLVDEARAAGIRRVVFVCPGCRDEWETVPGAEALELVALPQLLARSGMRARPEKVAALVEDGATVALFDSCHDRDGRFGGPLRELFSDCRLAELAHHGESALCCGAAGAVSLVDAPLCARRARRMLDEEPREAGAGLVVTNCPTCAYTFASERRGTPAGEGAPAFCQYLEALFEHQFDWDGIFERLEAMWTGEYGAWVCEQLL